MTPRQKEVFDFISAEVNRTGISPSYEEIAKSLGFKSTSGVGKIIGALAEQGFIRNRPHCARSTYPVPQVGETWVSLGDAVRDLLSSIRSEDPDNGLAIVDADALGAVDIAYQEVCD